MGVHRLSFADISILQNDIAEIVVDEGVEIDQLMVAEYHQFLLANLSAPFAVLVNRKNAYTYTFEAQKTLAAINEMNAIAVLAYNRLARLSTEAINNMPREVDWNMQLFSDRNEAFNWLLCQQRLLLKHQKESI